MTSCNPPHCPLRYHSVFAYTSMVFDSLFSKRVEATSSIYLVARPEQARQHVRERLQLASYSKNDAGRQELDPAAGSELWPWPLHIPPCARVHLQECLQISREKCIGDMVNLMQNPCHMAPCRRLIAPTLLRGSLLWSLSCQRLVCPMEYMLMQGIPAAPTNAVGGAAADDRAHAHVMQCPFVADLTESFSESTIRRMAGNAMHVQQVGAVYLLVYALLAELQRLPG